MLSLHAGLGGRWLVGLSLCTALALIACGDDDGSGTTSATGGSGAEGGGGSGGTGNAGGSGGLSGTAVTLQFAAEVDGTAFDCASTYSALGTQATEVEFHDFRLYVHDVHLIEAGTGTKVPVQLADDGLWQHQPDGEGPELGIALLDFEDDSGSCQNGTSETNSTIVGAVPEGDYDGISFRLGVPSALNHADVATAPSPLNLSAMFWNWNGGYKHLRIDTEPVGSGNPFNMHLGSTMCMGDAIAGDDVTCANENRPEIVLQGFDASSSVIVLDYAKLVEGADLTQNEAGMPGCQSMPDDTDCTEPFAALGIDHGTGSPTGDQAVFTVGQ